jgi:hypothetical protein
MTDEPLIIRLGRIVWILAGLIVSIAAGLYIFHSTTAVRFGTPYQAILLTNGSVYSATCMTTGLLILF